MIKFKLRKNLLYLLVFFISYNVRNIVYLATVAKFEIQLGFSYIYLMCLAEVIGGLILYLYQHFTKRKNKESKFFAINAIFKEKRVGDGLIKVCFLLFFASFFDFYQFIIDVYFVPLTGKKFSHSIDYRLSSSELISSALICTYALGFKIKKHHKASLIAISACLLLTLINDGIFINGGNIGIFFSAYFLVFYYQIIFSFNCCIEKYLVDINFMNPFKILMCEGIIMFILSIFASIGRDPFKELKDIFEQYKAGGVRALFIFFLILLFILSMFVNIYKVYCNVIYSPMACTMAHFLLNPISNIYYFLKKEDFGKSIPCLIFSEIICLAIDFFAFVYNEYLILFCCDLEVETVDSISERASSVENIPKQELYEEEEEKEEEEDDKNDNFYNNENSDKNKKKDNSDNVITVGDYIIKMD